MRSRKPRFRMRELQRMRVGALREMLRDARLSDAGFFEKQDLIQKLVDAKVVQLVSEPPPVELDCDELELRQWTAKRLKELMASVGVDATTCIEKSELIDHLLA